MRAEMLAELRQNNAFFIAGEQAAQIQPVLQPHVTALRPIGSAALLPLPITHTSGIKRSRCFYNANQFG
ncbi:hypothetical protein KCP69_02395 [Salmonella enterica subsp. enterica]|nr:hypothetical protein KCP69_02395 [Salmonella enterica subsp. enterica]